MKKYSSLLLITFAILFLLPQAIIAQKKAEPKGDIYAQQVQTITKDKRIKEAFVIIDNLEPTTRKEHIELNEVPAPPFKEAVRAQYYKKMLEAAGSDKVWIDSVGNVLALRKGKKEAEPWCWMLTSIPCFQKERMLLSNKKVIRCLHRASPMTRVG